ncbi:hypothetical protein SPBR_04286 [Sporothrix brasiliensis 5110]|uniref:Uncharacterized protein n=1 Tax=Sporothrix brasiliensis 5110 TaxID=1398154 RepID=A0A0C2J434_9PEZI|nr:uncharacterized protein SPBR_04286 [Sporothrix brasiliensis 5110]KIH93765.1 hypothetical protein SPBR_04286 [Sporothrix brasiliensis 5110]
MTLLDTTLNGETKHIRPVEGHFVKAHVILFTNCMRPNKEIALTVTSLLDGLDTHIAESAQAWTEAVVSMAIVNRCAPLTYGGDDYVLMKCRRAMNRITKNIDGSGILGVDKPSSTTFARFSKDELTSNDPNILSVCARPNDGGKEEEKKRIQGSQFKQHQKQQAAVAADNNSPFMPAEPFNVDMPLPRSTQRRRKLPENWLLWGLLWAEYYYPQECFAEMDSTEHAEKLIESGKTGPVRERLTREDRILRIARRLAEYNTWILYDAKAHKFSVNASFRSVAYFGAEFFSTR